jgi:hypothetical protein
MKYLNEYYFSPMGLQCVIKPWDIATLFHNCLETLISKTKVPTGGVVISIDLD